MKWIVSFFSLAVLFSSIGHALPGNVSGTQLWLRADAGVNGAATVSQWDDQSGNGRNAIQNNTNYRPTYKDNEANFNPTFYYTNHFLDVPYASELNGADLTVFVVVDLDGGSSWRSPWTTRDDAPSRGHILYYNNGYRYWTGHGTNGGWDQLVRGDTTSNYEILTTTSDDRNNGRIRKSIFLQGLYLGNQTVDFSPNTQRPFRIGKGASESANGAYPWYGDIAEIIVYPSHLSSSNRRKIESYLAVKYGITLDQSNNGKNYYDSGGTRIWRASNNNGYGNDIAGLGRDDTSDLDQKISKSINNDAIVTTATTNDFTSTNQDGGRISLSGSNRRFLIWSNDDGGHGWTNNGAPAGGKIFERKWKVQKTRANQHTVNIQVDTADPDFDMDNFNGTLYFVHGTDLSQATPIPMTNEGNGKWHIENIDFDDGDLFSFVVDVASPEMHIAKTSIVLDDPVNGGTHPKRIPGATIRYCFTVDNNGTGAADDATISDSLTGGGRDNLHYEGAGGKVQANTAACDCNSTMTSATVIHSGTDVTINLGTITSSQRGCAYIETTIN